MDKEYVLSSVQLRIDVLKDRYKMALSNRNEHGALMKASVAGVARSLIKKELNTCYLINELVTCVDDKRLNLSDAALDGLDKIVEPIERHRRLR